MEHLLIGLIVTIGIATIVNVYLKKLDIPTVIGYIFTGFAIAQIFHFGDASKETLAHLAEFGIVFLMFISLHFAVKISSLSDQVKNLAQKLSLHEAEKEGKDDHARSIGK